MTTMTSEHCCGVRSRASNSLSEKERTERAANQSTVAMAREVCMTEWIGTGIGTLWVPVQPMKQNVSALLNERHGSEGGPSFMNSVRNEKF